MYIQYTVTLTPAGFSSVSARSNRVVLRSTRWLYNHGVVVVRQEISGGNGRELPTAAGQQRDGDQFLRAGFRLVELHVSVAERDEPRALAKGRAQTGPDERILAELVRGIGPVHRRTPASRRSAPEAARLVQRVRIGLVQHGIGADVGHRAQPVAEQRRFGHGRGPGLWMRVDRMWRGLLEFQRQ